MRSGRERLRLLRLEAREQEKRRAHVWEIAAGMVTEVATGSIFQKGSEAKINSIHFLNE